MCGDNVGSDLIGMRGGWLNVGSAGFLRQAECAIELENAAIQGSRTLFGYLADLEARPA